MSVNDHQTIHQNFLAYLCNQQQIIYTHPFNKQLKKHALLYRPHFSFTCLYNYGATSFFLFLGGNNISGMLVCHNSGCLLWQCLCRNLQPGIAHVCYELTIKP